MTAFTGFPAEAWDFLVKLSGNNTNEYFDAHREQYRRSLSSPSAAFVDAVVPRLREFVHPRLQGEPRVGRSLFRINRDTRFSHDKTPYKTHLDFMFWIGNVEPRQSPACIMRITAATVLLGAGQIGLAGAALRRYHEMVAGTGGRRLRDVVDRLQSDGSLMSEPDRARVPFPYRQDDPNADLLRHHGFHLTHTRPHPDELGDERFISWTAAELSRYRPLLAWLDD